VLDARHEQHGLVEELTDRERSILRALPGPLTLREIGGELFLSLNTVKGYTKSLYRKLGVSGREEAVSRARAVRAALNQARFARHLSTGPPGRSSVDRVGNISHAGAHACVVLDERPGRALRRPGGRGLT
jgi:DNA-binding CsgD family transcriptional regulator